MSTSTLSRAELQALAKQHGIKANMKNAEIEKALAEKGVSLVTAAPIGTKPRGLSVRNENVQTVEQPAAKKKAVKAVAAVPAPSEAEPDPENVAPIARRTRRSLTKESEQPSEEPENRAENAAPVARRTRRSATKESEQQAPEDVDNELPPLPPSAKSTAVNQEALQTSPVIARRRSARLSRNSTSSVETPRHEYNENELDGLHSTKATAGDRSPDNMESPMASVDSVADEEEKQVGSNADKTKDDSSEKLAEADITSAIKVPRQGDEEQVVEATPQNTSMSTDASSSGTSEVRRSMRQIRFPSSMREEKTEAKEKAAAQSPARPHPIRTVPLLLPPTPEHIRKKMDEKLAEHKTDLDRLIANYANAIQALESVPALLQKQKQLLHDLERSREENKRLRDYIACTD